MRDRLFLMWNCPGCAEIKNRISLFEEKIGAHGQGLTIIHTFNNESTRDVLDLFGMDGFTPSIQTYDDRTLYEVEEIIDYLELEGFTDVTI